MLDDTHAPYHARSIVPPIPLDIQRLAIVCPSWVGDTVMATPVLRAARVRFPAARIVGLMRRGLDDLLRGSIWLDEMVVVDTGSPLGPLRGAAALRAFKPDAVLLLPNSFRSALTARLSGSPIRAGYARDHRGWLLTHGLKPPRKAEDGVAGLVPMVEYYIELAKWALELNAIDSRLELAVTRDESAAGDSLLTDVSHPFVLLNPGANRPDKRWPAERFAALADQLASSHGTTTVVSGSSKEANILETLIAAAKTPIINLAARGLTLGGLKAVIQRAALVVTNDTGPRHVAAALGTPLITFFGPTDHRWTTLHCPRERMLLAEPFLPAELVADRYPRLCAIERISVADAVAAARSLLGAPREEARATR